MWYDYLKVCRPLNCFIAVLAVIIGGIASFGSQNGIFSSLTLMIIQNLFIGAIGAGFISAGGYVINDVFDVEIDKINRPSRPIARGAISVSQGRKYAWSLFAIGIILCILTWNLLAIGISLCAAYMLYRYSTDLKRNGISGNLTVAILTFILFIYGGVLTSNTIYAIFPALFGFFLVLSREIVKDVEDISGDQQYKCLTLPIRYGVKKSLFIAKSLLTFLAIIIIIPYILGIYSSWVYPLFIGINEIFLATVIVFLSRKPEMELIRAATPSKQLLKLNMLLGTMGFFIASIIPIF
ncbi:MAG: UbiA family prenyltransferase [Candidatus Hodarchaeota archaeon]